MESNLNMTKTMRLLSGFVYDWLWANQSLSFKNLLSTCQKSKWFINYFRRYCWSKNPTILTGWGYFELQIQRTKILRHVVSCFLRKVVHLSNTIININIWNRRPNLLPNKVNRNQLFHLPLSHYESPISFR